MRNQVADWVAGGLQMAPELHGQLRAAALAFGRVATQDNSAEAARLAAAALTLGFQTGRRLVQTYVDQVFSVRTSRAKLDTLLGCRLGTNPPSDSLAAELTGSFHHTLRAADLARDRA